MRRLFFSLLMFCVLPAWADGHDQLYKVAGWAEQRAHFNDALSAAQQRYRNSLPPANSKPGTVADRASPTRMCPAATW